MLFSTYSFRHSICTLTYIVLKSVHTVAIINIYKEPAIITKGFCYYYEGIFLQHVSVQRDHLQVTHISIITK